MKRGGGVSKEEVRGWEGRRRGDLRGEEGGGGLIYFSGPNSPSDIICVIAKGVSMRVGSHPEVWDRPHSLIHVASKSPSCTSMSQSTTNTMRTRRIIECETQTSLYFWGSSRGSDFLGVRFL